VFVTTSLLCATIAAAGDARGVSHVYETPNAPAAPGEPVVALTFDDGPHPQFTPPILDILRRYGVKATFFMLGSQAERHPDLVRQVVAEGHVVANHTWMHPHLPKVPADRFAFEIDHTTEVLQGVSGQRVTCVRPPYGDSNPAVTEQLNARGLASVVWTADSRDFEKPGVDAIVASALKDLQPGGVILMHDGGGVRDQTIAALPRIIEGIQAAGYRIAPICGSGPRNAVPVGAVDAVRPGRGEVSVQGWAVDPDTADPIEVRVTVDGTEVGRAVADLPRPDVAAGRPDVAGLGERHGFDATFTARSGTREVCVHAVNVGVSNTDALLGCRTIDIGAVTALDDLRDFVAKLRWEQLVEQVHLTQEVQKVRDLQRAPWQVLGPVAPDAIPAAGG
jgi:peptidoglycan/xylan/chitin deacetylase (PgdA/CDA1 family)